MQRSRIDKKAKKVWLFNTTRNHIYLSFFFAGFFLKNWKTDKDYNFAKENQKKVNSEKENIENKRKRDEK